MGRKPIWTPEDIKNFKEHTVLELRELYPDKTYNYLREIKRYYMERQPKQPNNPDEPVGRLYKTWETSAFNKETGEWETAVNHGYDYTNNNKTLPFEPVVPAIIKMSRARIPKRDYKGIFVFSDAQIGYRRIDGELVPIHDESAIRAAQELANDLKPNYVVDNGDTTDFAELSRYPVDSTHFQNTLQPSLQRTHDMLAEFTAATPGAERHTVGSNHVKRLSDFVLRNAFPLAGIRGVDEVYPAMSYPGLIKLDKIGWQWHDGYGSAEYEYAPDLAFIHGQFAVSNGSTANKLSKANYGRNIVQGHKHSIETHYHTDRRGRQFGAFVVGALCRTDGYVPSFHSSIDQFGKPLTHYENWQNGVMYIKDYGNGQYQFDQIPITNGVIFYNGRSYGKRTE